MPSIPQSLLWISLVVLWLFVLVPMLISKRDAVRRTSDVALATRVLNGTTSGRLLKRGGPASGHRSDPDWRASEDDLEENFDEDEYDDDYEQEEEHEEEEEPQKTVVLAAPVTEDAEPEFLDVEVVDEPAGALTVGESADELTLNFEEQVEEENVDTAVYEIATDEYEDDDADGADDEYEYVDDSSGLEAPEESDLAVADSIVAARRRRYDPAKAAAVSARKYKFRKRMLAFMTLVMLGSAAAAYFGAASVAPLAWYVCGGTGAVTLLYLGYLRRQTRIEERVRRRRAQRAARSRLGVENTEDRDLDLLPPRLRRPGSVVLEIDDEDPIFEHLEYAPASREYHLPRAAGQ
ncbi:divisome protein SepX/GlpR [Mycolicibacterium stellerae]|uniref:divisome protein SepX/GlpR n=1 Tax=Mycolicibacterium stellerae TaxID=2358193 RepID=UPI000F0BC130|nr:gephyrin-like molybdotransferase receptor GlpR [Mycolicibacterium stellerae]